MTILPPMPTPRDRSTTVLPGGRRGSRIVGAEHSSDLPVAIQGRPDPSDRILRHDNVGVDEEQDLAPRMSSPVIARRGGAGVPGEAEDPSARVSGGRRDVVFRGVIDDDKLGVEGGRGAQRRDALRELARVAVRRHDYGYQD